MLVVKIIIIWIVASLIYGTVKGGTGWMAPFKAEYRYQFEKSPVITIIVTGAVCLVLAIILF